MTLMFEVNQFSYETPVYYEERWRSLEEMQTLGIDPYEGLLGGHSKEHPLKVYMITIKPSNDTV